MVCDLHASEKALWVIFHEVLKLLDSIEQQQVLLCQIILEDTGILKVIAGPEKFCLSPEQVCKVLKESNHYKNKIKYQLIHK